jgi:hypothetical protein
MKRKLIAACLLLATLASAATIQLVWDANAPAEQVTGYNVYERVGTTTNWTRLQSTQTNGVTLNNVGIGSHTYAVTATNAVGESPLSVPVSTTIPPSPSAPANVVVKIIVTVTVP